jgi:hypothetical protein
MNPNIPSEVSNVETVFYQTALDDSVLDRQSGEKERVRLQDIPPVVGETVSMGGDRLWSVVDVDAYSNGGQSVFIAYVALASEAVGDRSTWYSVEAFKRRPQTNLKLFFSEDGQLLHLSKGLLGQPLTLGYVLPKFDVQNHTVGSQPWGVMKVEAFQPKEPERELSYAEVILGYCAYIPELVAAA